MESSKKLICFLFKFPGEVKVGNTLSSGSIFFIFPFMLFACDFEVG
jgi:hypothetical protein